MQNLPIMEQRTALLRLSPPVKVGRDAKRQEASIYIQDGGILSGSQVLKIADEESAKLGKTDRWLKKADEEPAKLVKADRWHVLSAVVDCISGTLVLYLDGTFVRTVQTSSKFNATKLGLGSQLIVFGGGKQSESRGGDVRYVRLIDGALKEDQLKIAVTEIQSKNPLYRESAVLIQALARCILDRARCVKLYQSSEVNSKLNIRRANTEDESEDE